MGGQVSKIMGKIFGTKEMRIPMLGLDAAGKTSESAGPEKGERNGYTDDWFPQQFSTS